MCRVGELRSAHMRSRLLWDGVQAVMEAEAGKAARTDVVQAEQGRVKAIKDDIVKLRSTLRHLQSSQRALPSAALVPLQVLTVVRSMLMYKESSVFEMRASGITTAYWPCLLVNGDACNFVTLIILLCMSVV